MEMPTKSRAPLIVAITLLLLPVLYVGSYLAMVKPDCQTTMVYGFLSQKGHVTSNYRWGDRHAAVFFWPLEQIDRKVRPGAWGDGFERIGIDFGP